MLDNMGDKEKKIFIMSLLIYIPIGITLASFTLYAILYGIGYDRSFISAEVIIIFIIACYVFISSITYHAFVIYNNKKNKE